PMEDRWRRHASQLLRWRPLCLRDGAARWLRRADPPDRRYRRSEEAGRGLALVAQGPVESRRRDRRAAIDDAAWRRLSPWRARLSTLWWRWFRHPRYQRHQEADPRRRSAFLAAV